MPGQVPTWAYELPLDARLERRALVPPSTPMHWLVLQARTSGSDPQPLQVMVGVQFGTGQLLYFPTPVSFSEIHQSEGCAPHEDGLYVTVAPTAGAVLSAYGGSR